MIGEAGSVKKYRIMRTKHVPDKSIGKVLDIDIYYMIAWRTL